MKPGIIPILLLFASCTAQTKIDSDNFYFLPETFKQEKAYYFKNQTDTTEVTVWKMKTIISNGDTLLQTTIFNNDNIAEKMIERIRSGNSKILSYTLFRNDKSSDCTIIDSSVYKIRQSIGEQIKWLVTFNDFNTANTISISKIRKLESSDQKQQIFLDQMSINAGGTSGNYEYAVRSVYEKGVGLVSYKITRPNGQVKDFKLTGVK